MRTASGLVLVLLAAASGRAEPRDLRWHPREGSLLEIRVNSTTRAVTVITGEDGKENREKETLRQQVTLEAEVKGASETGNLDLRLRVASFRTEQTSGGRGVAISGRKAECDDPVVEVEILGRGIASVDIGSRAALERLAENTLSCRWSVVLTPRGEAVSATNLPFCRTLVPGSPWRSIFFGKSDGERTWVDFSGPVRSANRIPGVDRARSGRNVEDGP